MHFLDRLKSLFPFGQKTHLARSVGPASFERNLCEALDRQDFAACNKLAFNAILACDPELDTFLEKHMDRLVCSQILAQSADGHEKLASLKLTLVFSPLSERRTDPARLTRWLERISKAEQIAQEAINAKMEDLAAAGQYPQLLAFMHAVATRDISALTIVPLRHVKAAAEVLCPTGEFSAFNALVDLADSGLPGWDEIVWPHIGPAAYHMAASAKPEAQTALQELEKLFHNILYDRCCADEKALALFYHGSHEAQLEFQKQKELGLKARPSRTLDTESKTAPTTALALEKYRP